MARAGREFKASAAARQGQPRPRRCARRLTAALCGTSFLLISHDPDVLTIADRILVMYAGQVVEEGPSYQVLSNPKHPYTAALLQCADSAHVQNLDSRRRRLPCIPGQAQVVSKSDLSCSFAGRCSDRMEVCDSHPPALVEMSTTRSTRCFKYTDEVEPA